MPVSVRGARLREMHVRTVGAMPASAACLPRLRNVCHTHVMHVHDVNLSPESFALHPKPGDQTTQNPKS